MTLYLFQKYGEPIKDRSREMYERPRAFEALGQSLQLIRKAVDAYQAGVSRNLI